MYQVLEYDSGITYKVGEYDTKAEAVSALQDDGVRYDMETKGEVIWNKNCEGFKVRGLPGVVRMWVREVQA